MKGFFNLDGPFYKWGTEIADIMILSLLWLLCCLPVVTIGASTTALFYVFGKKARKEDPYIVRSFFKSFKENFLQATILTFILGILWFSVYLYYKILTQGTPQTWLWVMGIFFILQVSIVTLYLFPILSRFDMSIKNLLLSGFIFGNRHLPTTILCGALFLGCILLVMTASPFTIFAFGIYAWISSYLFQRVFTRHINLVLKEENESEDNADEIGGGEDHEELEH